MVIYITLQKQLRTWTITFNGLWFLEAVYTAYIFVYDLVKMMTQLLNVDMVIVVVNSNMELYNQSNVKPNV
jgi:hypothetical protein